MQEATILDVNRYIVELDTLQRRADLLGTNLEKFAGTPGADGAKAVLEAAKAELDQLHRLAGSAPTLVATAAKSNNPEEISKVHDETLARLREGIAIAKDELVASGGWLGAAVTSQPTGGPVATGVAPTPVRVMPGPTGAPSLPPTQP